MLIRLTLLLIMTSIIGGCYLSAASPPGEVANRFARVKLTTASGNQSSIPLGNQLTLVNLFDEFSSGCPTGNRFDTMERLNSSRRAGITVLLVFSDKHFSNQDLENFKAILPMADSLVRGDIEPIRPHLTLGKLLVVLDAKGSMIWQEKPNTSEQQVFSEISRLIDSASK